MRTRETFVLDRREFLAATTAGLGWLLLPGVVRATDASAPTENPIIHLKLAWTDELKWGNAVDISRVSGKDLTERLANAQALVAA